MSSNSWTRDRLERIANFWADRLVLEAAALDVFGYLADGPLTAEELADILGLQPRATLLFLDALTALGLLEKEGARYRNGEEAARFLVPTATDYLGHELVVARRNWEMWGDLHAALRTGQPQRDKRLFIDDPDTTRHLLLAVHRHARSRAADLLERGSLDVNSFNRMLDLGGGAGTYSVAFCRANSSLRATLVDRPIAAAVARDVVASAGLEDRISVLEYDVDERALPSTYDFIWVSNVIQSRSYEANRMLFQRLYSRLESDGLIAVQDIVMEESRTQPAKGAVFSLHMLLSNGLGRCYTFLEIQHWLSAAGFREPRWIREEDEDLSLVVGRK